MSPFDVILFDVGGVLLTNGWDRGERAAAAEHFGLDAEAMEARNAEVMAGWDRSEIDRNQYLDATVFYEPRSFSPDEFFDYMLSQSRLLADGAIEILREVAGSNRFLVGSLNNEPREPNEFRFGKFELRRYFRVAQTFKMTTPTVLPSLIPASHRATVRSSTLQALRPVHGP